MSITVVVDMVQAVNSRRVSGVSLMPTYDRGQIVLEDQVGVYHCIARYVRRAFFCGVDPYTGQEFTHRKEWILDRMRELAGLFAIEECCYSVMSNRHHFVLRNRPGIAEQWSDDEIALRWRRVFPPSDDATGEPVEPTEHHLVIEELSRLVRPTRGPGRLDGANRSTSLVK